MTQRSARTRRWGLLLAAGVVLLIVLLLGLRQGREVYIDYRVDRYGSLVDEHAQRTGLSPRLLRAVIEVESGGDPRARSKLGAVGLMQITGVALKDVRRRNPHIGQGDLTDPAYNLLVGSTYLSYLLDRFDGDLKLALAAYHMGPTAVAKARRADPALSTDALIAKHAGPKTRAYVRNVLAEMS